MTFTLTAGRSHTFLILRSFPKDVLALAILASISSSISTFLDKVLPRYVNLSTVYSFWPLSVMVGSE